ncbi:MAG TPA: STN domain-containing protein [Verrucomicrobiae bacterium]|nr:STN domain-containing protein [Verrucomicrobiae bacterium]
MNRKLIIGCLAVVLGSSCSDLGRNEGRSSSPLADRIHRALNQTVIPEVDLESVSAVEALNVWSELSRTYHPQHFKFQHVVAYPVTFTQGTTGASASVPKAPKVTVRRKNITAKRLLDEICRQANLKWTITGRVIVIKPGPPAPATP